MKSIETQFSVDEYDPDTTLVAPRFDAGEEVTARPVVPLANEVAPRGRRTLPFWLLFVAAFIGGATSVLGFYFYQRQGRQPEAVIVRPQANVNTPPAPAIVEPTPTPAQLKIIETVEKTETAKEPLSETAMPDEPLDRDKIKDAKKTVQPPARVERDNPDERERKPPARRSDERSVILADLSRRVEEPEPSPARPIQRRETTETRPRTTQPRPTPTPARSNASRIRDIFEGVPPL